METYLLIALITVTTAFGFLIIYHLNFRKKTISSQKRQSEFMAEMIHELRSPLTIVKSSADLLIKEASSLSADQIADILGQVESTAEGLLGIVSNLLNIAKLEAGKIELIKSEVDVNELITHEAKTYESLTREKNLDFKLDLDRELGKVTCDPEKLKHILDNLISNAIKYTDRGLITIETEGYTKFVQVGVKDTGCGINDNDKELLFQKFTMGHSIDGKKKDGTGLGLVIVKGIVEAHGGRVWIEDNDPSGTVIKFTLPL
jgi:signal transduction histidine kinase